MAMKFKKEPRIESDIAQHRLAPHDVCSAFLQDCREQEDGSIARYRILMRSWWEKAFPNQKFPEHISMHAMKISIGYEILYQGYRKAGLKVPEKIQRNRDTAVKFEFKNMSTEMQSLYEIHERCK